MRTRTLVLGLCVLSMVRVVSARPMQVYWTDTDRGVIERANADGTNREVVLSGLEHPLDLDADLVHGKLYWTGSGTIERANLDGSEHEILIRDLPQPFGIAAVPEKRSVFWADRRSRRILEADLDGRNKRSVVPRVPYGALHLDYDPRHERVYWTATREGVWRADVSNGVFEEVVRPSDSCVAVEVQPRLGKVFWSEDHSGGDGILFSDFDAGERESAVWLGKTNVDIACFGIDPFTRTVYFGDADTEAIYSAPIGTGTELDPDLEGLVALAENVEKPIGLVLVPGPSSLLVLLAAAPLALIRRYRGEPR